MSPHRACVLAAILAIPTLSRGEAPVVLSGLHADATVARDNAGIAHIRAADEHDLFFMQGWVHAQDRLFQMDATRREANGTLAELLGANALPSDVQYRMMGLRRAAALSFPLVSDSAREALQAYADGVNAYAETHALPPEYTALKLTRFEPWTPLDSAAAIKGLAFNLSFNLDDMYLEQALQSYLTALGPDAGAALFSDLFRFAPFDPSSTVPDALRRPVTGGARSAAASLPGSIHPRTAELALEYLAAIR
ncbi:MAG TPA: penicillin acylase family protein, partial [Anaeromyxobacteraceae bacterium]|nr:penicillin acylase family protein [Anaeromyxobacteraceae bacterium]